ncbi:MAG: ATP synthase F1 subunit epsilon [Buchnera aphidicola (Eriosoma harunire)]
MNCYLNVVNMEKQIFSDFITKIQISSIEGQLGIYPSHSPLLTLIKPGLLLIILNNLKKKYIYLSEGILEVQPRLITILSKTAILGEHLNYEEIIKNKNEIEEKIKQNIVLNNKKNLKTELEQVIEKLKVIEVMKKM